MMQISDAHHFRKLVAGACMIAAPLLFLAASIVHPKVETDAAQQIAIVAVHQDRWLISTLLVLAGFVLFVPAILGLMHMLRERGVAFGNVGGAFALLGLVAAAAMAGFQLVVWQMVRGATSLA